MKVLNSIVGILFILFLGYLLSNNKKKINWRTVGLGFAIQFIFALLVLKWPIGQRALLSLSNGIQRFIDFANEGISFLFGGLIPEEGSIFALQVLPVIIFISSIVAVLYYLGIMQWFVKIIGGGISKLLRTSKVESLSASANIFLGQTEAPLLIKPYIENISTSELFSVMVGGVASVAGSVLVGYSLMGIPLNYLIAASFMAAPAGLVMSKLIIPETKVFDANEEIELIKDESANVIDAAAKGASDGLGLALNVGAMLLAFVSLIAVINGLIGYLGGLFGYADLSIQGILGYLFSPLAAIIGVPWSEAITAGSLIGQKVIVNEFVAFSSLAPILDTLSTKTAAISTFALCGFANISSIAILIGGIGGMAPNRKSEIAKLGVKAIIAGTLANLLSAAIAGLLIG